MFDCPHDPEKYGWNQGDVQNQRQPGSAGQDPEELTDDLADLLARVETDSDVDQIERLLAEIDPDGELDSHFDAEQALAQFHQKHDIAAPVPPSARRIIRPRILRYSAHAAVVAILLISCMMAAAQASGFDILGAFARWTDAQFHFEWAEAKEPVSNLEQDSLLDALQISGVKEKLAPTWLPEDAVLHELSAQVIEKIPVFAAAYQTNDGNIFISIRQSSNKPFSEIEKDASQVDIYVAGGIEHHIMCDVTQSKATWQNGDWECMIAGNISGEELIAMIDSIYEG